MVIHSDQGQEFEAIRVGRSHKAEGWFLTDRDLSWGQQVAVMFQIISTLTLEVPSFLEAIAGLRGVSPNVQLYSEPWGMSTTVMHTVFVCLRIGQPLMCMNWPSCLGSLS